MSKVYIPLGELMSGEEVIMFNASQASSGHGRFSFSVDVDVSNRQQLLALKGQRLEMKEITEENGISQYTLCHGDVSQVEIFLQKDRGWVAKFVGYSDTWKMDQIRVTRIFQDTQKTLKDVVQAILEQYEYNLLVYPEMALPGIILQYQETDWQFLNRIVGAAGFRFFVNEQTEDKSCWIDAPDRPKVLVLTDAQIRGVSHDETGVRYQFESDQLLSVGDVVMYQLEYYTVERYDFEVEAKRLKKIYTIYCGTPKIQSDFAGYEVTLPAVVKCLEGDGQPMGRLQVQFDLEEKQAENPAWIDWGSAYVGEDTGFYCMPQPGEKVLVCISQDACHHGIKMPEKEHIYAYGCVSLRQNDIDESLTVSDKLFRIGNKQLFITDNRVEMKHKNTLLVMEEDKITLTNEKGRVEMGEQLEMSYGNSRMILEDGQIKIENSGRQIVISGSGVEMDAGSSNVKISAGSFSIQ